MENKERKTLYSEFRELGIPTEELDKLSDAGLKQLLDTLKNAISSYKKEVEGSNTA